MAGVLLPFLKWFIGGPGTKGPKILNFLVRSPWSTIDIMGQVVTCWLKFLLDFPNLYIDMQVNSLIDTSFDVLNLTSAGQATYPFSFWLARRDGSPISHANAVC